MNDQQLHETKAVLTPRYVVKNRKTGEVVQQHHTLIGSPLIDAAVVGRGKPPWFVLKEGESTYYTGRQNTVHKGKQVELTIQYTVERLTDE